MCEQNVKLSPWFSELEKLDLISVEMGFQYYHHDDNKINQTKDLNNIIDGDLTTSSYSILNIEYSYVT